MEKQVMKFNELRDLIKYSREALECLKEFSDPQHGPADFSETIALLKHSLERAGTCEDPCEACQEYESEEVDSEGTPLCRKCFLELEKDHLEEEYKKAKLTILDREIEICNLREELADSYVELSGKITHSSQCATSVAPAQTPKKCDCAA